MVPLVSPEILVVMALLATPEDPVLRAHLDLQANQVNQALNPDNPDNPVVRDLKETLELQDSLVLLVRMVFLVLPALSKDHKDLKDPLAPLVSQVVPARMVSPVAQANPVKTDDPAILALLVLIQIFLNLINSLQLINFINRWAWTARQTRP